MFISTSTKMCLRTTGAGALLAFSLLSGYSSAAVDAAEAARLKTDLTPTGATKAGGAGGAIPAWTGGVKGVSSDL